MIFLFWKLFFVTQLESATTASKLVWWVFLCLNFGLKTIKYSKNMKETQQIEIVPIVFFLILNPF